MRDSPPLPREWETTTPASGSLPKIEADDRVIPVTGSHRKIPTWLWASGGAAVLLLAAGLFLLPKRQAVHPVPVPSYTGDLQIESKPSGAEFTIDGGPPARTPYTLKGIRFGDHKLRMKLDGYAAVERDIHFEGANPPAILLEPNATPPEQLAKLSIRRDPPGAQIRLDGQSPQELSDTFRDVKMGALRMTAILDGFETKEEVVAVDGSTKPSLVVPLERAKSAPTPIAVEAAAAQTKANLIAKIARTEEAGDWPTHRRVSWEVLRLLTKEGANTPKENREVLAQVIDGLRRKGPTITADEFAAHEHDLTFAAEIDVLPAILMVADNLKLRNSASAFDWYYYAATSKHSAYAMARLAWLYWTGACGQQADQEQGLKWFKLAYEGGETEAGVTLAKCYLRGMGIPKDEEAAISILLPLAKAGIAGAKTVLGQCYYSGVGPFASLSAKERHELARTNYEQAIRAGDWEACGHLGVMYETGQGVPKDWKQAARLYLQGVEHENPICMYYYALAIDNHGAELFKVLGRQDDAQTYYVKAAAASVTQARKWCLEHNVKF